MLEEALKEQGDLLNRVSGQLASASARSAAARPRRSRCASGQLNVRAATAETKPAAARPLGETPRPPVVSRPPAMPPVEVPSPPRIEAPLPPRVEAPPPRVEASLPRMEAPSAPAAGTPDPLVLPPLSSRTIPPPPPAVEPPEPSEPSDPPAPSFDWESLAGARLFPAISGIAIVLAAIFFLRYSAQQGW